MARRSRALVVATVSLASLIAWGGAHASPSGCARGIALASARYVQGRAKAIQRCEDAKTKGKLRASTVCTNDPRTATALGALATKLFVTINLACGGANRNCGDTDDEPLAPVGWGGGVHCPDLESSGCTNVVATCSDVSACLRCIGDAAVDRTMSLVYGAMAATEFGTGSRANRCQQVIGSATARYLRARSKILQRCWDGGLVGSHAVPCPAPGDGKAAFLLDQAERRKVASICKACGGPDGLCGGGDGVGPSQIGFAATCPEVAPLAGSGCGATIGTLDELVRCVDCVADFRTDCADVAAIPSLVGFPVTCNPNPTTTTTSTSSSTTTSSSSSSSTSSSTTSTTSTSTSSSTATSSPITTTTSSTGTTTSLPSSGVTCDADGVVARITISAGNLGGAVADVRYAPVLTFPGSGFDTDPNGDHLMDLTGRNGTLLGVDGDTDGDAIDDRLALVYVLVGGVTFGPGAWLDVRFDCTTGTNVPLSAVTCTVVSSSDAAGNPVAGTTCAVESIR